MWSLITIRFKILPLLILVVLPNLALGCVGRQIVPFGTDRGCFTVVSAPTSA